ncbi:MAG: excisionase family DNA-binding protein [Peptococcaceae bacterium]|nr:excisionase family DNA-binding protein [Peptococcaceae bacterium]
MSDNTTYTPEEVAKILKISKYTVYELIKRGELGAYRVGRKVRIEESDITSYKQKGKSLSQGPDISDLPLTNSPGKTMPPSEPDINNGLVICGQDIILDILTRHLTKHFPNIKFLRNYIGSMDGLIALYKGQANAVTTHLWDRDTDDYNLPYIRRLLPGHPTTVINLVYRYEGFFVASGNPKKISSWSDLARPDVRFINREHGSGARVLLDEKLQIEKIPWHLINGYDDVEMSHMSVASKVARKEADVGIGIEKVAMQVPGLEFIPLQKERYDLVIRQEDQMKPHFQALLQIIRSSTYRNEIEGLGGYDVSQMGKIMI